MRQSPAGSRPGPELPWQGLALGQPGCRQGDISDRICAQSASGVSSICRGPSKGSDSSSVTLPLWPFPNDPLYLHFLTGNSHYLMVVLAHDTFPYKTQLTQVHSLKACPWTLSHILNLALHNYSSYSCWKHDNPREAEKPVAWHFQTAIKQGNGIFHFYVMLGYLSCYLVTAQGKMFTGSEHGQ